MMMRYAIVALAGVVVMAAPAGHGLLIAQDTPSIAETAPTATTATTATPAVDLTSLQPGDTISMAQYAAVAGAPEPLPRAEVARLARSAGNRINVPSLGAGLPLVRSSVRGGQMQVPGGVKAAGWLTSSVRPGAARGTTVIATHRDTGGGGRGTRSPLYDAERLRKGQVITVRQAGNTTRYMVQRVTWHSKDRLPVSIMSQTGPHRLALITCGGKLVVGMNRLLQWSKRAVVWATAVR